MKNPSGQVDFVDNELLQKKINKHTLNNTQKNKYTLHATSNLKSIFHIEEVERSLDDRVLLMKTVKNWKHNVKRLLGSAEPINKCSSRREHQNASAESARRKPKEVITIWEKNVSTRVLEQTQNILIYLHASNTYFPVRLKNQTEKK